jgi:hypothetical protein
MTRKINWGRVTCPKCGDRITRNALGRAAHIRHCTGRKPGASTSALVFGRDTDSWAPGGEPPTRKG